MQSPIQYPSCCISGTEIDYSQQYHRNLAHGNNFTDEEQGIPFLSACESRFWVKERDGCCNGETVVCCEYATYTRILSVVQSVWDLAACFIICPSVCVGSSVSALGGCCVATVLRCVECGYVGERKNKAMDSTDRVAQWAANCFGNGMLCTAASCAVGVRSVACCLPRAVAPEILNMWCYYQECNVKLSNSLNCDEEYQKILPCDMFRNPPAQAQKPAETPGRPEMTATPVVSEASMTPALPITSSTTPEQINIGEKQ